MGETGKRPGAEPDRLVIPVPFEEAAARLIRAPLVAGEIPEKPKRKRRSTRVEDKKEGGGT